MVNAMICQPSSRSTPNREFAALLDDYTALDAEIYEIEENGTNVTDEHAEELKFKRVALKDKLYAMLQEHAA